MEFIHLLFGTGFTGAIGWLWALAGRIAKLEFQTGQSAKDITVFADFMMRRGMVDALKGALKMNSPISVPAETIKTFGPLVEDLKEWWKQNKLRFSDDVKNRRLFLELSDKFGDRFVNEICLSQDNKITVLETAIIAAIQIINPQPQTSKQTMRQSPDRSGDLADRPSDKTDLDDTELEK